MSATAVVPAPGLRNDLPAARHHFLVRVRLTLRDPLAMGVVLFAGVATVAAWAWGLGIDSYTAGALPHRGEGFWHMLPACQGCSVPPPPAVSQLFMRLPSIIPFVGLLMWTAMVAGAAGGAIALHRASATQGRPLPVLPIGPRARILVEAMTAMAFVLLARAVVLALGGLTLGRILYGHRPWIAMHPDVQMLVLAFFPAGTPRLTALLSSHAAAFEFFAYASSYVVGTVLGSLISFPLVLAWGTLGRVDLRGLVKPALVVLLLFTASSFGLMAHLGTALLVSTGLCAFLLVRLDPGERAASAPVSRPLRFRPSPGALLQLRRDAWFGPLRLRWRYLLLVAVIPFLMVLAYSASRESWLGDARIVSSNLIGLVFAQWVFLLGMSFLPFGLALVRSGTPASTLFGGSFLRSWGALPVPSESVTRSVYVHALTAAALAWLLFAVQVRLLADRWIWGLLLFELPAVLVLPAIVLCEAVGDRRRGFLAVAGLAGFQFGVPFTLVLVDEFLGGSTALVPGSKPLLAFGGAYLVALVGALPPLVHLRGRVVGQVANAKG